jgi:UDP-N-acetyl-D-glucosamine dehydrogenase
MNHHKQAFLGKTRERSAVVSVIGLGYVGLPLAMAFARSGIRVVGIDLDARKIASIGQGRSYIQDVPSEALAQFVPRMLTATQDYAQVRECDAMFICVPTPFDTHKTPDLSFITAAAEAIAPHLRPGHLVVLQSTTYPGTTEEVVKPILERGGLRAGTDFFLAFSPERIDPGNAKWTADNTPKIVGGLTPDCAELAMTLLRVINPQVHGVSSPRAAEMTKLLENTFRSVNIALVNELALLAERMGIDIWEVIDAAATKPFGFMPFYPGPGVGGHCIPIDPLYLSWKAREFDFYTRFIELAADINERMPFHVADLVAQALSGRGRGLLGAKVLVLGAAFKANVDDARHAPAQRVMELLIERGAQVCYHDPHVPSVHLKPSAFIRKEQTLASVELTDAQIAAADCVAVLVGHRSVDYQRVLRHNTLIVDTTGIIRALPAPDKARATIITLGSAQASSASS